MYTASGTKAYAQVSIESGVMSANPHQLIEMLFDGANSALVRARLFMQQDDIVAKGEALSKAINIIDNGLKAGLDQENGGDRHGDGNKNGDQQRMQGRLAINHRKVNDGGVHDAPASRRGNDGGRVHPFKKAFQRQQAQRAQQRQRCPQ